MTTIEFLLKDKEKNKSALKNAFYTLVLVHVMFTGFYSTAQEATPIGQYMYNQPIFNAAAYGTGKTQFNLHLLSNISWIGVEGAPQTNTAWADYRIDAHNMAIGLSANQTRLGSRENLDLALNYAYQVKLNRKTKLSMGLNVGVLNAKFAGNNIDRYWDVGDELFESASYSFMLPKFGLGFFLFQKKYYLGLSSPDLVLVDRQNVVYQPGTNVFSQSRSYFATGGMFFRLSDLYSIKPHFYTYYHPIYGFRADVSTLLDITDYFWLGGTYSTSSQQRIILGTNMSTRMRFGYSFAFITGAHTDARTLSSHELNLMIRADNLLRKQPK